MTINKLVEAAAANDLISLAYQVSLIEIKDTPSFHVKSIQDGCHVAALHNHPEALNLLLDAGGCYVSTNTILSALEGESKDVFDALIARGWSIHSTMSHMGDSLMYTCPFFQADLLTGRGYSIAVGNKQLEMVEFLLSRGAKPDLNHSMGMSTALELACRNSTISIIEVLLDAGSKLNGSAALRNAELEGRLEVIDLLLDRGANIDRLPDDPDFGIINYRPEWYKRNPLCEAAAQGHPEAVRLLLEWGADPTLKDLDGHTALELARSNGHDDCGTVLETWRKQS